eukprot:gene1616-10755_t
MIAEVDPKRTGTMDLDAFHLLRPRATRPAPWHRAPHYKRRRLRAPAPPPCGAGSLVSRKIVGRDTQEDQHNAFQLFAGDEYDQRSGETRKKATIGRGALRPLRNWACAPRGCRHAAAVVRPPGAAPRAATAFDAAPCGAAEML